MSLILAGKILGTLVFGSAVITSTYFVPRKHYKETQTVRNSAYIYGTKLSSPLPYMLDRDIAANNLECQIRHITFNCEISTLASNNTNQYKMGNISNAQLNITTTSDFVENSYKNIFQIKFDGLKHWQSLHDMLTEVIDICEITVMSKRYNEGKVPYTKFHIWCAIYEDDKVFQGSPYFIAKAKSTFSNDPYRQNLTCKYNQEKSESCSLYPFEQLYWSDAGTTYDKLFINMKPLYERFGRDSRIKKDHYYLISHYPEERYTTKNKPYLDYKTIDVYYSENERNSLARLDIEGRAIYIGNHTGSRILTF